MRAPVYRIPTVDQPAIRPAEAGYVPTSVPVSSAATFSRQLTEAADIGLTALIQKAKLDDDARLAEAVNTLTDAVAGYIASIKESRKGLGAEGVASEFRAWFDEAVSGASGNISSEENRRRFFDFAARLKSNTWSTLLGYEAAERVAYRTAAREAAVDNLISRAHEQLDDNSAKAYLQLAADLKIAALRESGRLSPEVEQAVKSELAAKFHKSRFELLASKDTKLAIAYYKTNANEFAPNERARIGEIVSKLERQATVEGFVEALYQKGIRGQEAVRSIYQELSGEDQKLALALWRDLEGAQEYAARQARDDLKRRVLSAFIGGGYSIRAIPKDLYARALIDIPDVIYDIRQIVEMRARAREDRAGGEVVENAIFSKFYAMAMQDPERFKNINLSEDPYALMLPPHRFDYLLKLQQERASAPPAYNKAVSSVARRYSDIIKRYTDDKAEAARLESLFFTALHYNEMAFVEKHKRPPTEQELNAVADSLLARTTMPRTLWFDKDVFTFQKYYDPAVGGGALRIMDIPQDIVLKIRGYLRSRGLPDTDANVIAYYNKNRPKK